MICFAYSNNESEAFWRFHIINPKYLFFFFLISCLCCKDCLLSFGLLKTALKKQCNKGGNSLSAFYIPFRSGRAALNPPLQTIKKSMHCQERNPIGLVPEELLMGSFKYLRALGMNLWCSHLCVFWQTGEISELSLRNQSALVRVDRLNLP